MIDGSRVEKDAGGMRLEPECTWPSKERACGGEFGRVGVILSGGTEVEVKGAVEADNKVEEDTTCMYTLHLGLTALSAIPSTFTRCNRG